jgi:hypothetical protein
MFHEPAEDSYPRCCSTALADADRPAMMPGFHAGRSPRNKGVRSPADPPTIEE